MYSLPNDVIRHIYEFDGTYINLFNHCVNNINNIIIDFYANMTVFDCIIYGENYHCIDWYKSNSCFYKFALNQNKRILKF